jgi:hypothetical protein
MLFYFVALKRPDKKEKKKFLPFAVCSSIAILTSFVDRSTGKVRERREWAVARLPALAAKDFAGPKRTTVLIQSRPQKSRLGQADRDNSMYIKASLTS